MAELMTVSDVAKLLKVSRGAVQRWIRNGQLATIKTPGGHYRITQSAAEALMQEVTLTRPEPAVAA